MLQGGFVSVPPTFGHHPPRGPSQCHLHLSCLLSCRQIFHPETTDIYDKKNMPRVVYCIHALRWVSLVWPRGQNCCRGSCLRSRALRCRHPQGWGDSLGCCGSVGREKQVTGRSWRASASSFSLYLFKLGLAPQIQDLYGKVDFTGTAPPGGTWAGGWRWGFANNALGSLRWEGCGERRPWASFSKATSVMLTPAWVFSAPLRFGRGAGGSAGCLRSGAGPRCWR